MEGFGFKLNDFQSGEFEIAPVVSPVEPKKPVILGVPINEYKRFKAINHYGDSYYMSGVTRGGY